MNRLLFIFCSLIILSSCHYFHGERIKGDGNVTRQARNVSNFTGIDVSGGIDVYVRQDSSGYSVNVEIDNNLQPYILVSESGGILQIRQTENTSLNTTKDRIMVYVSGPAFKKLEASGACKIISEGMLTSGDAFDINLTGASDAGIELKSPAVTVDLTGASTITLKGETKDLRIEGSGASHIKCFELLAENVDINLSGACSAEVFASVKLNADASGASNVRYKGNAAVTKDDSGASSVKKAD